MCHGPLIFPTFRGHGVKVVMPRPRIRLGSCSPGSNAAAGGCRTPRSIQRSPEGRHARRRPHRRRLRPQHLCHARPAVCRSRGRVDLRRDDAVPIQLGRRDRSGTADPTGSVHGRVRNVLFRRADDRRPARRRLRGRSTPGRCPPADTPASPFLAAPTAFHRR